MIENNPMAKQSLIGSHVWKRLKTGIRQYRRDAYGGVTCYVCGKEIKFRQPGTWKYDSPYRTAFAHHDCDVR